MNYIELSFDLSSADEYVSDVLADQLAQAGFESFVNEGDKLLAYCPETEFAEQRMLQALACFPLLLDLSYTMQRIKEQNWNEEWEKNLFKPIYIDGRCCVHSPAYEPSGLEYDIVIDPHLAFGTASHDTTQLLLATMMNMNFAGKRVLDMGCGTGVLGIFASMLGAKEVTAIDIDKFSFENTQLNATLNGVENVKPMLGDASLLHQMEFDVVIANINRNILIRDMEAYCGVLCEGGTIIFSGFYSSDVLAIDQAAEVYGLTRMATYEQNDWTVALFKKGV